MTTSISSTATQTLIGAGGNPSALVLGANGLEQVLSINGTSLLHHNDIVNGDFRVAQAGTSFAAPISGAYDLDGWLLNSSSTSVLTVAQVAGSVAGRLARQVTITTADVTVAAGDVLLDATRVEGYNIQKYIGRTFTVAFRAKVPVAGIHCVALRNGGDDRSYINEINFPAANVWQDCSFTVTGGLPTAGTWNYTNGIGLLICFTHMCGSTYQTTPDAWNVGNFLATANQVNDCATVGNVWALESVTLNLGTVATVSEISYEREFARCQRYFLLGSVASYTQVVPTGATGSYNIPIALPTIMRANPVVLLSSIASNEGTTYSIAATPSLISLVWTFGTTGTAGLGFTYTASARL